MTCRANPDPSGPRLEQPFPPPEIQALLREAIDGLEPYIAREASQ